jgi:hypothetical protein
VSIGTLFLLVFWQAMGSSDEGRGVGPIKGPPPAVLAYLNPFLAQVDVLCGTETPFGGWCSLEAQLLPDPNGVIFQPGNGIDQPVPLPAPVVNEKGAIEVGPGVIDTTGLSPDDMKALQQKLAGAGGRQFVGGRFAGAADVAPFGVARDAFWPKSVATWFVLSVAFVLLSVQFVSPTRRWRLRRGRQVPEAVA